MARRRHRLRRASRQRHAEDLLVRLGYVLRLHTPDAALPRNGRGVGNICNAPLQAGDDGAAFRAAFEGRILPALESFGPDLILVSAGFDAHRDDPLADLRLLEPDFAWATDRIVSVAHHHCDGRIVSFLEGGYQLDALARSTAAHVEALMRGAR